MKDWLVGATLAVVLLTALAAVEVEGGLYSSATPATAASTSGPAATPESSTAVSQTIFIHVINSTSGEPIAGAAVKAGPASSATDIDATFGPSGGWTVNECVHEVGNGAVVQENGNVVYNGTTTTYASCPLKNYSTNATGWVTVPDQNTSYFFVQAEIVAGAAGILSVNAQVIAVQGSQTYVTAPIPEGNFTISSTG